MARRYMSAAEKVRLADKATLKADRRKGVLEGLGLKTDALMADVLAWVNEQRHLDGLEPLAELPVGVRNDPTQCVLGRALECSVEDDAAITKRGAVYMPAPVRAFVRRFDMGGIASLVDRSSSAHIDH